MEGFTNKVVLVPGHDRREMVRFALTQLGEEFRERVSRARQIFIHPNLVTDVRADACTDVEALRGVLDHLSLLRGDPVLIGDAVFRGEALKTMQKFGYDTLTRSGNPRFVDLNQDKTIESYAYTAELEKRLIGFSRVVADSDFNIVVVPAKMHSYYIVSLSIKTHVVGSLVVPRSPVGLYARWPWLHTGYKPAHLSLAHVYADHPAQLAVIDATQAMQGNGPAAGEVLDLGWLIASFNPVVADALASYLMGLDPVEIGYLYHLGKMGWGPIQPLEMEIVGPEPDTLRKELQRPDSYSAILDWK